MENTGTKAGTIGGTFLTVAANIHNEDVMKTIVLAAIGAIVSFSVSLLMKLLILKLRKQWSKQEKGTKWSLFLLATPKKGVAEY